MSKLTLHQVRRRGAGRQLVFVNGFGCDQNVWNPVADHLSADHAVLQYNYAGNGPANAGSYDTVRHATLQGHASDLLDIMHEAGIDNAVLVGHSVGTLVSILASQREPALFHSMILLAPSPSYQNFPDYHGGFDQDDIESLLETLDSNHFAWSRMMAPVIMGNEDRPELAEELGAGFCALDPAVARHFARIIFTADYREVLPRSTVPALLLQCQDDALAAPSVGRYMADHMPRSRLVELQATGHCPHISAPAEVLAVLRNYLSTTP